jgi:hypothetical protein
MLAGPGHWPADGEKASENMPVPSLSPSSSSSISSLLGSWPGLLYHVTALSGAQEERRAPIWWGGQAGHGHLIKHHLLLALHCLHCAPPLRARIPGPGRKDLPKRSRV